MTRALVPLANGVEEMEAVIIIDTLRRAGWDVVSAGIARGLVTASRGVRLAPDADWSAIDPATFDALVIPGGSDGTAVLCRDERVLAAARDFMANGKTIGAICAGPLVLQSAGVLEGRKFTCYPGIDIAAGTRLDEKVVVDGNIVTSQGPGTAFDFALTLIGLNDKESARKTASAMLLLL